VASQFSSRLSIGVNESTVRGIKKAYINERSRRLRDDEDMVIEELPPKKQGRPLLLGATLDSAIQQYILKLRERGIPVNTTIVRAAAKGIAKVMDKNRLADFGGPATLSVAWSKSILRRMNFTKR